VAVTDVDQAAEARAASQASYTVRAKRSLVAEIEASQTLHDARRNGAELFGDARRTLRFGSALRGTIAGAES
jgi:hypothetical protein